MNKTASKTPAKEMSGWEFDRLPAAEKGRMFREIEQMNPAQLLAESRPLNKAERARDRRIKAKMGRPRIGEGVTVISLSMEQGLLKIVDAFAEAHNLKRSELVSQALKAFIRNGERMMKFRSSRDDSKGTANSSRSKRRLAAG